MEIKEENPLHCSTCVKDFQRLSDVSRHMKLIHSIDTGDMLKRKSEPYFYSREADDACSSSGSNGACNFVHEKGRFRRLGNYRNHLEVHHKVHGASIPIEHTFDTFDDFEEWKATQESNDMTFYIKHGGAIKSRHKEVWRYYCNRSGSLTSKGTGKRLLKSQGSFKSGHDCTSTIVVIKRNNVYNVTYHPVHYGHNIYSRHSDLGLGDLEATTPVESFYVGQRFKNYAELHAFEKDYASRTRQTFVVARSSSIESRNNQIIEKCMPGVDDLLYDLCLKYCYILYTCVMYDPKPKGPRKTVRHSSFSSGCPVNISIFARRSADGECWLEVRKVMLLHNHDFSKLATRLAPHNRRLSPVELRSVGHFVNTLQTYDTRVLQNHIALTMGKQLTIKDVRNLKIRLARQARDEWAGTVKIIKDFKENHPDSVIEVLMQKDTQALEMIIMQTGAMRSRMETNAEVVQIDGSYLLNQSCIPLYAVFVESGGAQSPAAQLGAIVIMMNESNEAVETMLQRLVSNNPAMSARTKYVIVDRDRADWDPAVGKILPRASTHFAEHLVLMLMCHELATIVSDEQRREKVVILLNQLVSCPSVDVFHSIIGQLSADHNDVFDWLTTTWLCTKEKWAACQRVVAPEAGRSGQPESWLGSVSNYQPGGEFARIGEVVSSSHPLNEFICLLLDIIQPPTISMQPVIIPAGSYQPTAGIFYPTGYFTVCVDYAQGAFTSQLSNGAEKSDSDSTIKIEDIDSDDVHVKVETNGVMIEECCDSDKVIKEVDKAKSSAVRIRRMKPTSFGCTKIARVDVKAVPDNASTTDGHDVVPEEECSIDNNINLEMSCEDIVETECRLASCCPVENSPRVKVVSKVKTMLKKRKAVTEVSEMTKRKAAVTEVSEAKENSTRNILTTVGSGLVEDKLHSPSRLDKYKKALKLATSLASLMSDLDGENYDQMTGYMEKGNAMCAVIAGLSRLVRDDKIGDAQSDNCHPESATGSLGMRKKNSIITSVLNPTDHLLPRSDDSTFIVALNTVARTLSSALNDVFVINSVTSLVDSISREDASNASAANGPSSENIFATVSSFRTSLLAATDVNSITTSLCSNTKVTLSTSTIGSPQPCSRSAPTHTGIQIMSDSHPQVSATLLAASIVRPSTTMPTPISTPLIRPLNSIRCTTKPTDKLSVTTPTSSFQFAPIRPKMMLSESQTIFILNMPPKDHQLVSSNIVSTITPLVSDANESSQLIICDSSSLSSSSQSQLSVYNNSNLATGGIPCASGSTADLDVNGSSQLGPEDHLNSNSIVVASDWSDVCLPAARKHIEAQSSALLKKSASVKSRKTAAKNVKRRRLSEAERFENVQLDITVEQDSVVDCNINLM